MWLARHSLAREEPSRYVDRRFDQVDLRFGDLRQYVDTTALETRRHFDIVAEGLRAEVQLLAEGYTRIDRVETVLRQEIVRSHDDLASLIRLAYIDLDRRVRVLEQRPPDSD
jgi:hypothetical protein